MNTETVEYKNHAINIDVDVCPCNPFEDWDGLPHLIALHDGYISEYNDNEYDFECLPVLTRQEIKDNLKGIKRLLEDHRSLLTLLRNNNYAQDLESYGCLVDALNETLQEFYEGLYNKDKLNVFSEILSFKGVDSLVTYTRGYCQGDHVNLLLIADANNTLKSLENSAELYGQWTWGDVYDYSISNVNGGYLDSCGGFYGSDHEKSGLLEYVKNAIDCEISNKRRAKLDKLK